MKEVLLVFFVVLIYGLINFLGGIFVRKTIIDNERNKWKYSTIKKIQVENEKTTV